MQLTVYRFNKENCFVILEESFLLFFEKNCCIEIDGSPSVRIKIDEGGYAEDFVNSLCADVVDSFDSYADFKLATDPEFRKLLNNYLNNSVELMGN